MIYMYSINEKNFEFKFEFEFEFEFRFGFFLVFGFSERTVSA